MLKQALGLARGFAAGDSWALRLLQGDARGRHPPRCPRVPAASPELVTRSAPDPGTAQHRSGSTSFLSWFF